MTDGLHMRPKHRQVLEALLQEHLPGVEVWAYGSRVSGRSHDGSDLDLVLRGPDLKEIPGGRLGDFEEAVRESTIPFLVEARDWSRLPERFHKQIERDHVVLVATDGRKLEGKRSGVAVEWPTVQLGEVVDLLTGFPFKSDKYVSDPEAPRLLRGDNIAQGTLRWSGAKRWLLEATDTMTQFWLREGDVVLAMDRPWIEAGLKFSPVRKVDLPALLVQRVARLRGSKRLDTRFLNYVIGCRDFTAHVISIQTGTAVPHISARQIKEFEFPLPPLSEQRAIAHILGTLDDKIELNRRMNETLEAMARALFKSWFVDFDPVRAKMAGRDPGLPQPLADLFPNRLVDSELGEIPEGWDVGCFGNVVERIRENENPLTSPNTIFRHFSIPAFDEGRWPKTESGDKIKSHKSRVFPGTILLSKLNPEIERVWLVDMQADDRAVCSTEFLVLRPRPPYGVSFVYCLSRSPTFQRELGLLVTGTSKSHQRAPAAAILALPLALPPRRLTEEFEMASTTYLRMTQVNRRKSRSLATLRDTLLPKLVSGKLKVNQQDRGARRHLEPHQ